MSLYTNWKVRHKSFLNPDPPQWSSHSLLLNMLLLGVFCFCFLSVYLFVCLLLLLYFWRRVRGKLSKKWRPPRPLSSSTHPFLQLPDTVEKRSLEKKKGVYNNKKLLFSSQNSFLTLSFSYLLAELSFWTPRQKSSDTFSQPFFFPRNPFFSSKI